MRPKKPAVEQILQLQQARQPELVLHHAVLHAGRRGLAVERQGVGQCWWRSASRRRCACRRRWPCGRWARGGWSTGRRSRPGSARRPARRPDRSCNARRRAPRPEFLSLFSLRPTRIGSGMIVSSALRRTPPCWRMARIERTRCWLVPIRPGHAVHDDADSVGCMGFRVVSGAGQE